ncbi:MAG TPA: SpoIIE family protein phosphatase [Feifaniaceae bacterium]|nr:SpoIIE family protein phosphatase [Feifaniaceae bacterium]
MSDRGRSRPIRAKIVLIVLSVSILALLASAAAAFWGMGSTRATALRSSEELGRVAAADSEAALVRQAEANLQRETQAKAELTEERLVTIREQVALLAAYVAPIYGGAASVTDARPGSVGGWVMQYAGVNGVSAEAMAAETARTAQIQFILDPVCRGSGDISSIYFASEQGFMVSYDNHPDDAYEQLFLNGYDPRQRDWYTGAASAGGAVFTGTYLDVFGRLLTTCAAPVYAGDGTLAGVLGMDILIQDINESVVSAEVGINGYAFLIDKEGNMISSPTLRVNADGSYDEVSLTRDADFAEAAGQMILGKSGVAGLTAAGRPVFLAYAPVSATGWSLGMVLPREEVVAPAAASHGNILSRTGLATAQMSATMRAMFIVFACVLGALVGFVLLAADILSKRLTDPIHRLIEEVNVISGGDLTRRVEVRTGDEMEALGEAFNGMTASLRDHIKSLAAVTADRERIAAELGVAATIQSSMLPCIFPPFPERTEFDIFAGMHPAKEVGGDFYDFFFTGADHLWLVVADVSGKGVPAALFMVITKTLLKNQAGFTASPAEVLTTVNGQLYQNNEAGMFVTAFIGCLAISTGQFTFANAGHNFPLVRRNGRWSWLKTKPGLVLAGMEGLVYRDFEEMLSPGDRIFLYTDGVTEALNPAGELYGNRRLEDTLNASGLARARNDALIGHIKSDIDRFAAGEPQADDITMLALQYFGLGAAE